MKFVTGQKLGDLTLEKSQIGLYRVKSISFHFDIESNNWNPNCENNHSQF